MKISQNEIIYSVVIFSKSTLSSKYTYTLHLLFRSIQISANRYEIEYAIKRHRSNAAWRGRGTADRNTVEKEIIQCRSGELLVGTRIRIVYYGQWTLLTASTLPSEALNERVLPTEERALSLQNWDRGREDRRRRRSGGASERPDQKRWLQHRNGEELANVA